MLRQAQTQPFVRSIVERFRARTILMNQAEVHLQVKLTTIGSICKPFGEILRKRPELMELNQHVDPRHGGRLVGIAADVEVYSLFGSKRPVSDIFICGKSNFIPIG